MLRLKSPGHERLMQNSILEATFGGSESNVAISCANYGIPSRFVTVLPKNMLGDQTISYLRSFNVDTSAIVRQGNRLGLYFLETGSGPRPSTVIYDRDHSSISEAKPEDFDWDLVFQNGKWFHISGITPAISQNGAEITLRSLKEAKERGLNVSLDLNYRKNLWNYGKDVSEVMSSILPFIDVLIANEEDIQKCLDIQIDQKIGGAELDREKYVSLASKVCEKYPQLQKIAITLRESYSADYNRWAAMLYENSKQVSHYSKNYDLHDIVDRVGGGDSFGGGLVYALCSEMDPKDALEYAVAASALKHTIIGDANRVSVDEVRKLMGGDASGRVQR